MSMFICMNFVIFFIILKCFFGDRILNVYKYFYGFLCILLNGFLRVI